MATRSGLASVVVILIAATSTLVATSADARTRANVADGTSRACLVLEWNDPHELLPVGERFMAKETTRILEHAKIPARWDWSRGHEPAPPSTTGEHRLRVVLVPSEPSGPGWGLAANTLGATVHDGASAPPAVFVFYHSVISALGRPSKRRKRSSVSDPRFLGRASRALARVVAHEVAHAIAPLEPHASSGLMQAGLAPELLTTKGNVSIDEGWGRVLSNGLARLCSER